MLEDTHVYFHQAADVLKLSDKIREILWHPMRIVKVEIVTEADDGLLMHHVGFRVQHNSGARTDERRPAVPPYRRRGRRRCACRADDLEKLRS